MNPSICAGSMPPYGWATYRTGTPRSGKMSRDMRSIARKPTNAMATTIVKSEIGRRNANDTRFIVSPQHALPHPDDRARLDGSNKKYQDISEKCSSYAHPQVLSPRNPTTSSGEQSLNGEPSRDGRGSAGPDDRTWQSSSIFSTKFKFSFVKSNSIRRMKLGLLDNSRVNSYRLDARIRRQPTAHELDRLLAAKRQTSRQLTPRRENQSLAPLLDLAAVVDDKGHFLAVLHRLDGRAFGGGFDVSDLRITRGFQLGCQLLLGQGMGRREDASHHQSEKDCLRDCSRRHDLCSLACVNRKTCSETSTFIRHSGSAVGGHAVPRYLRANR